MALSLILNLKLTNNNTTPNPKLLKILTLFISLGALLLSARQKISNVSDYIVATWRGKPELSCQENFCAQAQKFFRASVRVKVRVMFSGTKVHWQKSS